MDKRTFLKSISLLSASAPMVFPHLQKVMAKTSDLSAESLARNEDFWAGIRSDYRIKPDYINLENGYYCMLPEATLNKFIEHVREVNYHASWYMRTVQWENKRKAAAKLAEMAGCDTDELVITRNTTESLDLIIAGMDWKAGDEAVMAEQDYGAMLNQFGLMERRYGIKSKRVMLPNHPENDDEIVELYRNALTDKTKLLMVCHMVNITGHILPIRKICDMAKAQGVEVMVDGAHAFGHFDYKINDLNCDYYGTSLHKWLSVPLGAGFLYVNKSKIPSVWPLLAEGEREPDDIERLNHIGTHPVHTDLAISNAIDYHNQLGMKRKEARLRFLQYYWTSRVRDIPNVVVNTPADQNRHCAIGNVGIEGIEPKDFAKVLLEKYKIWTVAIDRPGVRGLRITPNVYTTTNELDAFIDAIKDLAA